MVEFIRTRKRLLFMAGDVLAVLLANLSAIMLRFDFEWSAMAASRGHRNVQLLILDLVLTPLVFYLCGLYQGYWKYAGLDDLVRLARAVGLRTVSLIVLFYALDLSGLSRAVVIISTVLLMVFAGALRLAPRFVYEFSSRRRGAGRRSLIVGAGDTGESLLRELRKSPQLDYAPVGFIDDDHEKLGAKIHGIPVLGDRGAMKDLIEEHGIREVIIAIPEASGRDVRALFEICRGAGVRVRTVPTRGELQRGAARVSQIRPVELEDLLGREVVNLDLQLLRAGLQGRRVLVTGAAGSIGRELARQIAGYEPEDLVLLDRNENNLFYLESDLRSAQPLVRMRFVVGDVLDRQQIESLFGDARPQVVFHAAAYKHVPLMEQNPGEAIKNNVIATRVLAEIAAAEGTERFIYVSTDKAVRPTSVMGATKRLGERLIKSLGGGPTRFMTVRFGNVLGSDGSVVPTFRRQIAAGGPVTVTHPEATRYFMTIPEAVQLVLLAGVMGEGGEAFLLQMGQPIRILDMARSMIELSGFKPDEEIKITFTGLRPGEKLHEELKAGSESAIPTDNEKILVLSGVAPLDDAEWRTLEALETSARDGRTEEALGCLRQLVEDYDTPLPAASSGQDAQPSRLVDFGARRRIEPTA